jgi:hypothetical protein
MHRCSTQVCKAVSIDAAVGSSNQDAISMIEDTQKRGKDIQAEQWKAQACQPAGTPP